MSKDGRFLYAVDRRNRAGDDLKVFDLGNNATLVRLQNFKDYDIKRIKLLGKDERWVEKNGFCLIAT